MRIELEDNKEKQNNEEYLSPATVQTKYGERVVNPTKGMTAKQKFSYFATYYLPKILFVTFIVALTFTFLFVFTRKREPAVNILFVNHHMTDTVDIEETLIPYLAEQKLSPSSEIEINASVNMDLTNFASYEAKNNFDTLIASRSFSLMFADEDTFKACADATYFRYLEEYLSKDTIDSYGEENILWGYDDLTGEKYICGLRLNKGNCEWIGTTNYETVCVGILFSDVPDEKIKPLLQFILNYRSGE
jgi:hypothetical protein